MNTDTGKNIFAQLCLTTRATKRINQWNVCIRSLYTSDNVFVVDFFKDLTFINLWHNTVKKKCTSFAVEIHKVNVIKVLCYWNAKHLIIAAPKDFVWSEWISESGQRLNLELWPWLVSSPLSNSSTVPVTDQWLNCLSPWVCLHDFCSD